MISLGHYANEEPEWFMFNDEDHLIIEENCATKGVEKETVTDLLSYIPPRFGGIAQVGYRQQRFGLGLQYMIPCYNTELFSNEKVDIIWRKWLGLSPLQPKSYDPEAVEHWASLKAASLIHNLSFSVTTDVFFSPELGICIRHFLPFDQITDNRIDAIDEQMIID